MKYVIKNNGPLKGTVAIDGSKNSVLGLIAATLLTEEEVILNNVPNVTDVQNMLEIIEMLGGKYEFHNHVLKICNKSINQKTVDYESVSKLRASYYFLGSLFGRFKKAEVSMPGGCQIGVRPIDLHLKGFEALGAESNLLNGNITIKTESLKGSFIYLDFPSVGATINLMLAAVLADGVTKIKNCAKEPHVVDIANLLIKMGANIKGAGTDDMKITGVEKLHGTEHTVIPDQIEAGTFMIATAMTKGDVTLTNVIPEHLSCIIHKLTDMGASCDVGKDWVRVYNKDKFLPSNVKTAPYPGFPTDLQPQICTALGLADGNSLIEESIFENRFFYTDELARMGSKMKIIGKINLVSGVNYYKGCSVRATDLRAGAALVLAGLVAKNTTIVKDIEYIKRGYENFDGKLRNLGANIKEIS